MSRVEVRPVTGRRERRAFLTFPWRIYRGDPFWVPPLLPDRRRDLDPVRGPFYQRGSAELLMAWRGREPVGTLCVAEDRELNALRGERECIFGFFECRDDPEAAAALLDRASSWGRERGLDLLVGPYNLDYESAYGLLIEGRDRPPALLCGHTPEYYVPLVEGLGFTPLRGDNVAFLLRLDLKSAPFRDLARLAEKVRERRRFTIRTPDMSRWRREVDPLLDLMHRSLAHLADQRPWSRRQLEEMLGAFARIADPELILFAEAEGKLVGWFPGIPDMNEALIHANGLRYPWDYLRLALRAARRHTCLTVKTVLVAPERWGSGVAALLFDEMARRAVAKGYRWVDLSITSEDNPRTPELATRMGAHVYKRYRVYRRAIKPA
jgi:GNAT superfamily N-acetyltransferase